MTRRARKKGAVRCARPALRQNIPFMKRSRLLIALLGLAVAVAALLLTWALRLPPPAEERPTRLLDPEPPVAQAEPAPPSPSAQPTVDGGAPARVRLSARPKVAPARPPPGSDDEPRFVSSLRTGVQSLFGGFQLRYRFGQNAEAAKRAAPEFCRAAAALDATRAPFPPSPRTKDASELLGPLLGSDAHPGPLAMPDALRTLLRSAGDEWPKQLEPSAWEGRDFSWLSRLEGYDHWTLFGPGAVPLAEGSMLSAPLPPFVHLGVWSKLHLARGLASGDARPAAREVRKLAQLLSTTGLLLTDVLSESALHIERVAHAAAEERGLPTEGWELPPPVDRKQLVRVMSVAHQFFLPEVPAATSEQVAGCLPAGCAAVFESLLGSRMFPESAGAPAADSKALIALAKSRGCDARMLDRVLASAPFETGMAWAWEPEPLTDLEKAGQPRP